MHRSFSTFANIPCCSTGLFWPRLCPRCAVDSNESNLKSLWQSGNADWDVLLRRIQHCELFPIPIVRETMDSAWLSSASLPSGLSVHIACPLSSKQPMIDDGITNAKDRFVGPILSVRSKSY